MTRLFEGESGWALPKVTCLHDLHNLRTRVRSERYLAEAGVTSVLQMAAANARCSKLYPYPSVDDAPFERRPGVDGPPPIDIARRPKQGIPS